jgi:Protein of Unknown function (DUF2784)
MGYRLLATAVLLLHGGYLAYVVVGGFLAWRWPRTLWLHLVAAGWGIAVVVGQLTCPLTQAEDWARRRAGEGGLSRGFIDRYVEGVLYPERFAGLMQALAATAVAVSWLGLFVRHRARRSRRGRGTSDRIPSPKAPGPRV